MATLNDYLRLDPASARRQWESITRRAPIEPGGRQADFTPVETLLCLAAGLVVDRRKVGGKTAHRAGEPVPTLARLFRRSNGSIVAKMANLEGGLRHGAKHEIRVAAELLSDLGRLARIYRLIVSAARDAGVDRTALPDFLGLEGIDDDLVLVGQEELDPPSVERAVRDELSMLAAKHSDLEEVVTQRLLVAKARVGQHRFASEVLRAHRHRCVFCGLSGHVAGAAAPRMLVASHIKPWKDCTPIERLDARNGLTACPTHDVAFDTGLLTVNGGLRIHVVPALVDEIARDPATRAAFGRPPLAERLLLPAGAPAPREKYLRWHQTHVYRGSAATGT